MRLTVAIILVAWLSPSVARAQQPQGAVKGVILDSLGGAVSSAHVAIEGSSAELVTDEAGAFRFARVPAGEVRFRIRRLGYRPDVFLAHVQPDTETNVKFRLAALAILLPPVEVRRKGEAFDSRLAGYHARREKHVGHFITRDNLDLHDSPRFADVLRRVPGIKVKPLRGSGGGTTVVMRGNCSPLVFLDGFPAASGPFDLDMIDLASVEGIEVYSGLASVPPEFTSVRGGERCGVIAVWSRAARPKQRRISYAKAGELDREIASKLVYTAAEVGEVARLTRGTISTVYPDTLWRAGISGRVVAEFIVGTDGLIERETFGIVSTTHPRFSASVRAALEGATFRAATLAGQRVRQVVQIPFVFEPSEQAPAEGQQPDA